LRCWTVSDGERVAGLLARLYRLALEAGWAWDAAEGVWLDPEGRRRDAREHTQGRPVVCAGCGVVRCAGRRLVPLSPLSSSTAQGTGRDASGDALAGNYRRRD